MLRFAFAALLIIHGLIHLMGFARAFGLAEFSQLSQSISKTRGLLWLLAGLLYAVAMVFFLIRKEVWWMLAIPALIVSQVLIFLYWQDAKFGTIPNLLALIACVMAYGQWHFLHTSAAETSVLLPESLKDQQLVKEEMFADLPEPVSTWLSASGIVGKPMISTAHLYQAGSMRTSPDGPWMPVQAEQWFRVPEPGFIWTAEVGKGSLMQFSGRDMYLEGKGHMLIKVHGLITAVNAQGEEINQGTLVRYLSEIIWFPSAALAPYLRWEAAGPGKARASMSYQGASASGTFSFNEYGKMVSFEAARFYQRDKEATLENWYVEVDPESYRSFEGITVPTRASVTWKLAEGDYTWYHLEIKEVSYDVLPE